ncbi:Anti-sigma-F factor antagonist RsfB [Rhodococcus ruber]|nr:anti-sigma-factor antagonist [Rhodococcus ruber]CDZ89486.1 conserved hypothetical protein [Rhodococcus ruber]
MHDGQMNEATSEQPIMAVSQAWSGDIAVLSVAGDVDLVSAPQLEEEAVATLGNDKCRGLIVDLGAVNFLASVGIAVLVDLSKKTAGTTPYAVVAQGSATARPLSLLGLDEVFPIHSRLDEALAALQADKAGTEA